MRTIESQWQSFLAAAFQGQAIPPGQEREMKRCFFAGAQGVINVLWDVSGNDVSESAGVHVLEGLVQEAQAFAQQVLRGTA